MVGLRVLWIHAQGLWWPHGRFLVTVLELIVSQAETFHTKPWFHVEEKAHGYDGPLHTEPYDLAPISQLMLQSMESAGLPLVHDMFSTGDVSHGCGHAPRTRKAFPFRVHMLLALTDVRACQTTEEFGRPGPIS